MKTYSLDFDGLKHSITRSLLITVLILLVPLIAIQLKAGVNWSSNDFIAAGVLVFSTSMIFQLITKRATSKYRRLVMTACLAVAFIYIWAELAVGIFFHLGS